MSYLAIYLLGISQEVLETISFFGLSFTCLGAVGTFIPPLDKDYKDLERLKNLWKIGIPLMFLQAFIPNRETLVAMVTIPPVVEYVQGSEEMKKLPDNVVKFVNDYLTKEEDKD